MSETVASQVAELQRMTLPELREKWQAVFGVETKQNHRRYLQKRIAWELQRQHYGGLPSEMQARIDEYRREFEQSDPRTWFKGAKHNHAPKRRAGGRDRRLPQPGSLITREYEGREIAVTVLDKGFEYDGQVYRSLSGVARAVTGTNWNGYVFFGLTKGGKS